MMMTSEELTCSTGFCVGFCVLHGVRLCEMGQNAVIECCKAFYSRNVNGDEGRGGAIIQART